MFLRCLWTRHSALPCAHVAPGDALTPTTLLRYVFTILYNVWLFMSLNVCCLNLCVTLLRSTSLKPYTHFQYPFNSFQLLHAAFKETQFTTSTFTQGKKKRQASLVITSVWPLKSILSSKAKTRLWFPFLSAHRRCTEASGAKAK